MSTLLELLLYTRESEGISRLRRPEFHAVVYKRNGRTAKQSRVKKKKSKQFDPLKKRDLSRIIVNRGNDSSTPLKFSELRRVHISYAVDELKTQFPYPLLITAQNLQRIFGYYEPEIKVVRLKKGVRITLPKQHLNFYGSVTFSVDQALPDPLVQEPVYEYEMGFSRSKPTCKGGISGRPHTSDFLRLDGSSRTTEEMTPPEFDGQGWLVNNEDYYYSTEGSWDFVGKVDSLTSLAKTVHLVNQLDRAIKR